MRYLLDTNICIFIINFRPAVVRERFERIAVGEIGISGPRQLSFNIGGG